MPGQFFSISGPFRAEIDVSVDGRAQTFRIEWLGEVLSFADAFMMWQKNPAYIDFFVSLLKSSGLEGYVWEIPGVSARNKEEPFEFTLTAAGPFHRAPDYRDFREHMQPYDEREHVLVFDNLGRDAKLIVPSAPGEVDFRDLARFLANASETHVHLFWSRVGEVMENALSEDPVWLSVNGAGVAWLHVRVDKRPKYYLHAPYKHA